MLNLLRDETQLEKGINKKCASAAYTIREKGKGLRAHGGSFMKVRFMSVTNQDVPFLHLLLLPLHLLFYYTVPYIKQNKKRR